MKNKQAHILIVAFVVLLISACAPSPRPFEITPGASSGPNIATAPTVAAMTVPPIPTVAVLPTAVPPTSTPVPPTQSPTALPTFTPVPAATPPAGMSRAAYEYLAAALDILQTHSLQREHIDWKALRAGALQRAVHAQTTGQTYDAIRYAIAQLGDHHSQFYPPDRYTALEDMTVSENQQPQARLLPNQLAYLLLPAFITDDEGQRHLYVNQLQALIRNTDKGNPCGWVLDLRENIGGNIWPMFAGLGPLLGEGQLGEFVYPGGTEQTWRYFSGQALLDSYVMASADGSGYQLRGGAPPVAVLTGPGTMSAAEAVAIAFRGHPNTRSFGQATAGLTTANSTYPLSDGAAIVLTVVVDADRTGHVYGGVLTPDQVIPPARGGADTSLQAATTWLLSRPACRAGH